MSSNFFIEDHNDQDKVEEELDEEEEEVSEMQILHSREVEDTDRLDLNEFLTIAKEESKKDKEESININSPIVLSKQQQTFPTTIEKKEEEQIVSPFIDLSIFPKNIVDFTQLFQQERSEENKIDDESELLLDSLFYPHPIRLLVLQQKKKKKSTPSINAISSPIQSYPSSLNNLNNNNTIEELLDATFTLNHLLYICLILQRRQLYQMKQIQKLLQNNLNELNNYLFEINDFGMTAESICYCLESNRYLNESFEGKEIKKLNNNLTLGSLYVSKKKLINFIELYPELFEIIKFRKQVEVISLKFKCYQLLQNNDFKQVIYFTKKENTLLIKEEEEKEILNIEFKNLKEKTTLNIFNEEHLKTMFKILKTEFPLQRSSYKLSLLRKLLFNKYDFKHFNLISFLQAFPQHFIVNTKSTKQKVRIITKEQDLNNFKPKIENVLFSEKVIKSVNKNNNELQQLNEEDNNKQKKKELPILELPKDFKIISTFKEEEVDQWINENIYQPLQNNNENVVIGMDTEFDLFKLNKNYQLNPVLHEKLWILFKKQKEESINNKSYYKEEDIQLLKNYLREYDQNIYPDLIQISTVNSCLLYNTCEGRVKPSNLFRKIMMDKNVIKCWCSYSEDVRVISAWFKYYDNLDNNNGITTNVLNKEEEVYKKEQEDGGFKGLIELDSSQLGVANLIESSLGMKMGKERQVQVSRWSRKYLSEIQRKYAAQDAYINCLLYQKYNDEEKDYTNAEDEELISFSLFNPLND